MLASATIIFREVLEIAIIVGLVMAATKGLKGRIRLVMTGLFIGLLGASIVAVFTDVIANAIHGIGQEIFNAIIMFTAVGLLGWTVIWMQSHGRELAQNLRTTGQDVLAGRRSAVVLVSIVAVSTFREGAEIVLFAFGMIASGTSSFLQILAGAGIGVAWGVSIGIALYVGLLRASQKYVFIVTGWLLVFLSAGMAANGAHFLIVAGILPPLVNELWDTSSIVAANSVVGELLKVLIGYTPRPTGMEALFHVATVITIGGSYAFLLLTGQNNKKVGDGKASAEAATQK